MPIPISAATRNEHSFDEIHEMYRPRVYAFCLKRVGNAAEAEDLTQETFARLYRALDSFEGRSSLLTWAFGIAHHVCCQYFRQGARRLRGNGDVEELSQYGFDAAIEQRVDAARLLARCEEVLATARRPDHREIFRLRYAERRSIDSIAREVGKSSAAVKVSLRRSRLAMTDRVPELRSVLGVSAHGA
ncbi:MAG: RNA polymerase sigma factor [Myxococcota bacterium]